MGHVMAASRGPQRPERCLAYTQNSCVLSTPQAVCDSNVISRYSGAHVRSSFGLAIRQMQAPRPK